MFVVGTVRIFVLTISSVESHFDIYKNDSNSEMSDFWILGNIYVNVFRESFFIY